jgi:hypothetical protein
MRIASTESGNFASAVSRLKMTVNQARPLRFWFFIPLVKQCQLVKRCQPCGSDTHDGFFNMNGRLDITTASAGVQAGHLRPPPQIEQFAPKRYR